MKRRFDRFVGIDYSGAETPEARLPGIRVFVAEGDQEPLERQPPPPARHWSRRSLAEWLADLLSQPSATLVGIDHGFSFPLSYFDAHALPADWPRFLDDFQKHWPTDQPGTSVRLVRDGLVGDAKRRSGDARWLRLTERWTPSAKSVFQFDVQGQVATSTHAGLPWLRYLRWHCGVGTHFWPFDGWQIPTSGSLIAEVYPSLWMRRFATSGTIDQRAAFAVAGWLQWADQSGVLRQYSEPPLRSDEREIGSIEGWILGVC